MLVGGTAIAGYYAGHRRSDDLNIFVNGAAALQAATRAIRSLTNIGASVSVRQNTAQFFDAVCELDGHDFTAQAVDDRRLFEIGVTEKAGDGVWVADLRTLLKQKAATLVSRASEKDLFDLIWLLGQFPDLTLQELLALGAEVDGGMSAESVLLVLSSTALRESACDFAMTQTPAEVLAEIASFKRELQGAFHQLARDEDPPPIRDLIRALKWSRGS